MEICSIFDEIASSGHRWRVIVPSLTGEMEQMKTKINIDDGCGGDNNGLQCSLATVVLKVGLRSQDSIDKIRKLVRGFQGVKEVSMDIQKQLVIITVMGTMDGQALAEYLKKKLKRPVEIVPPKNDKEYNVYMASMAKPTTYADFGYNARDFHANIPCLPRQGMG
ncbi:hypothetical protein Dsin_032344 [Dipteronia sinensis]|uniref:Uncharacterized protein n=1 Tax=Dipteronia sinensis TaxID=43782 RepID=A0AAE0DT32_9ROSI|nr:hypothetical protein Dsin_032344 [Dipteronia sinensis]